MPTAKGPVDFRSLSRFLIGFSNAVLARIAHRDSLSRFTSAALPRRRVSSSGWEAVHGNGALRGEEGASGSRSGPPERKDLVRSSADYSLRYRMTVKANGFLQGCLPEELKKVLRSVASELGDVIDDMDSIQVVPLKGAMTNEVYQINWPLNDKRDLFRKVLVRIYGEGVDLFFNRDDEVQTFECISKHGQGPRLLGRFSDGRVEEFIHARTLSAADLRDPDVSALIASKLREFHNLEMPGPKNVLLWNRIRNWLKEARSLCILKDAKEFRLDALEEEICVLEEELTRDDQAIGFCHNDLQYGNIMMDEETRSITIIDYEYASYNPVAYDIANHFCEMAANYHTETPHILDYGAYPGLEERKRFVRNYLSSGGDQPNDTEINQLVDDVEKYTLVNHLLWTLWGIISSYVNDIDFDYKEYARQRFHQYWLRKPALLGSGRVCSEEIKTDEEARPNKAAI